MGILVFSASIIKTYLKNPENRDIYTWHLISYIVKHTDQKMFEQVSKQL